MATYRMGITLPSRAFFRTCHSRAIPFLIVPYQTSPRPYPSGWTFSAATVKLQLLLLPCCRIKVIWLRATAKYSMPLARLGHLNHPKTVSFIGCDTGHLGAPDGLGGAPNLLYRHFERSLTSFDRDCSHDTRPCMLEMNLYPQSRGQFHCHGTGW